MQLTHKTIARMAGYRVDSSYASYPNMGLDWNNWYYWYDVITEEMNICRFETEREAYVHCCITERLVEE